MLNPKKILVFGLLVLNFMVCGQAADLLPTGTISGHIIKSHRWNNYGYTIVLYRGPLEVARTRTSLNGYFVLAVPSGNYELYVYEQTLVALQKVSVPGSVHLSIPNNEPPFYPIETIGFFVAVLILGLGLSAWFLQRDRLGLLFLAMAVSFALVNSVEWLQLLVAFYNEVWAGTLFPLKHVGFSWFGMLVLFFVQAFVRQRISWWLLPVLGLESFISLSWLWLGSDPAFLALWHFSYAVIRDLCVWQTFFCVVYAYSLSVRTQQRALWRAALLWFLCVFGVFVLFPLLVKQGTEFFALQYNLAASLGGLILFISFFSVMLTFKVRGMEQFVAGSLLYSVMSIVLIGIYAVVIVTFGRFVQYSHNELLRVYALLIVVMAVLPFKDIFQKYLEQRLLGDTQKQREALAVLTSALATSVTFKDVQRVVREVFKKYFLVSAQVLRTRKTTGIVFPLYTQEPATLVLRCPAGKIFSPTEVETFEKIGAPLSLALDRVLTYEKQLRALLEIQQQARLASLGTLTAGLAHELKNPLAVMQNILAVLSRTSKGRAQQEFLPVLQRQLVKMQELLHNMLQFARPEKLTMRKIDLREVIEKTIVLFAATARKQQVSIEKDLQPTTIYGDERALEQVLLNLCLNSLESMPHGGQLKLKLSKRVLTLTDTGCGMSLNTQKRLFDPFFTTKAKGTGLGLAISKRILDEHQVKLEVISQQKQGTTFVLRFKRSQA